MAEKGWNAKGLLQPLWVRYPGGRDALAAKVGTTGNSLSARNTGTRNLGMSLGLRLADELGVSLLELGAPAESAVDAASVTLASRLESLAGDLAKAARKQATMATEIRQLRARVQQLEARPWPAEGQTMDQAESL